MKALLGRKIGMTQTFSPKGQVIPVTLVEALPNPVTLRRTVGQDGYAATQLALPRPQSKVKSQKSNVVPRQSRKMFSVRREFPIEVEDNQQELSVAQFEPGDRIEVSGTSKGKGFQGVVKRHHFKGGPASHGHRHVLRRPGSIGSRFPQHVFKGTRMAGRMGAERVTVKNLEVVNIDIEKNLLAIKGAIPGTRGTIVEIRSVESAES